MNTHEFIETKIPTPPVRSEFIPNPQTVAVNIKNPIPVGWLVISRDKETGGGVKMALYNKLPNKLQQFFIRWFFGWWVETESEQTQ